MDAATVKERVQDVCVVVATPFDDGLKVDLKGFADNVSYLARSGIRTILVGGNTGEFYALTDAELLSLTEVARAQAPQALLLAGVAGQEDRAGATAEALLAAGADGIMIHHPVNPYSTPRGIGQYFAGVAARVDAPVVVYPQGHRFTADSLDAMVDAANIVGVKYGSTDAQRLARLVRRGDGLAWSCGLAENWAPVLWPFGARGFTTGVGNVAPQRSLRLLDALRRDDADEIHRAWEDLAAFEELRAANDHGNNVTVVKSALDAIGLYGGQVRPPCTPLDPETVKQVQRIVRSWELVGSGR